MIELKSLQRSKGFKVTRIASKTLPKEVSGSQPEFLAVRKIYQ